MVVILIFSKGGFIIVSTCRNFIFYSFNSLQYFKRNFFTNRFFEAAQGKFEDRSRFIVRVGITIGVKVRIGIKVVIGVGPISGP